MNLKTMTCPITGINICKFFTSTLVGFAFIFGFDFAFHNVLLGDIYAETPELWRPVAEMKMGWMLGTQILLAMVTAFIYAQNVEGKGIGEGLRFGAMIGVFMAIMMAGSYAWMPISLELALFWAVGGLVLGLGLGVIYSFTYKCCGSCKKGETEKSDA